MVKSQKVVRSTSNISESNSTTQRKVYGLEKMKDGFVFEQSCRGNSTATVEYYKGNIDRFVSYLEEQGLDKDTSSITKEQIKKYILYLKNAKKWSKTQRIESDGQLTSKSVQTYIRALTWLWSIICGEYHNSVC